MELAKIEYEDHGIVVSHNMPCPICGQEPAVLQCNVGVFAPGWKCQGKGWRTLKLHPFARWILVQIGILRS